MANYRIRVECLNDEVELPEELERGMDMDGFVLLARLNDNTSAISIQHMSILNIADCINGNADIIKAAQFAILFAGGRNE